MYTCVVWSEGVLGVALCCVRVNACAVSAMSVSVCVRRDTAPSSVQPLPHMTLQMF